MIGLIIVLLFCFAVAFMFLMACVHPDDPTILGTIAQFVTATLPSKIGGGIRTIPGGTLLLNGSYQCFNYVAFKPNPILQTVYALLVFGGYGLVLWEAYPQIPNYYMAGYHKYIGIAVVTGTMWAWYKSCTVSPGYITATNYKQYDNYAVDKMMYQPDQYYTYKDGQGNELRPQIPKLPRSKHDAITGKVVARFDHFCPWLNNPVGECNYKYFLLFLFMTAFMLSYGTAASLSVVATYIKKEKLFDARYVNKVTGEIITASKHMVFQYCMHKQQKMMMLLFLCGIMGIVVFGFFSYHIYLVSINRTTNEGFKWSRYVGEFQYNERRRIYEAKNKEMAKVNALNNASDGGDDAAIGAAKNNTSTNQQNETKKKKKKKKKTNGICQPIANFFTIWLHGCFIVSCGVCGTEEPKEEDGLYDFSDQKFKRKRPSKYMYKLITFRDNFMEILYPRSQRTQKERVQLVTSAIGDSAKSSSSKKKSSVGKKTKQGTKSLVLNGNWTYHNEILLKILKDAGEGAKIEMVNVVYKKNK